MPSSSTYLLLITMAVVMWTEVTSYRAAVYEHALIAPPLTSDPVTRQTALEHMEKNLAVYRQQALEARRQGADILVFPENGIYGYIFTRSTVSPYLEFIPDPHLVTWSPCADPDLYPDTEVQHALSCMAMDNSLYLVADLGNKQPCDGDLDPSCPADGQYQYNTAVAYGPDGTLSLLAKRKADLERCSLLGEKMKRTFLALTNHNGLLARYHKVHLYKEVHFDYPEPSLTYFTTPFGNFGLLVCFDLLFDDPLVTMVKQHDIDNIIYPTAWMDSLPLLSAIGYHSSVARGLRVNLLASNLHLPTNRFHGSGIYTSRGMTSFYYNRTAESPPRLLVADVTETCTKSCRHDSHFGLHEDFVKLRRSIKHEYFVNIDNNPETFTNRNFAFIRLSESWSTAHVCRKDVCCYLDYAMTGKAGKPELFVLGAYDGVFHGKYSFQVCTVLKCPSLDFSSCGDATFHSDMTFSRLTLTVQMTAELIYPQVVLSRHGQLELAEADDWIYSGKTLAFTQALDTPLLSASLVGRDFSHDPEAKLATQGVQEDNSGTVLCLALQTIVLTTFCKWVVKSLIQVMWKEFISSLRLPRCKL